MFIFISTCTTMSFSPISCINGHSALSEEDQVTVLDVVTAQILLRYSRCVCETCNSSG